MTTGVTVIGKTMIYFFEYQMGDRNGAQIALMAFGLTGLLVIPFWTFVTLKTSKRFVWMVGSFFLSLALIGFLFNPAETQNAVILNYIAISFGAGAFAITFWACCPTRSNMANGKPVIGLNQWFSDNFCAKISRRIERAYSGRATRCYRLSGGC